MQVTLSAVEGTLDHAVNGKLIKCHLSLVILAPNDTSTEIRQTVLHLSPHLYIIIMLERNHNCGLKYLSNLQMTTFGKPYVYLCLRDTELLI